MTTRWMVPVLVVFCAAASLGAMRRLTAAAPPSVAASVPKATGTQPLTGLSLQADRNGHFLANAVVEGRSLRMLVDTGATLCAFSEDDADRIGIRVDPRAFTRIVSTANGTVRVAPVRIGAIQIGPILVRDVEAVVVPRGRLGSSLLGMSFLKRVRDFSITDGHLTLRS